MQLLRGDEAGRSEPDPDAFCELLLVLSYDVRVGPVLQRMSERTLRQSDAERHGPCAPSKARRSTLQRCLCTVSCPGAVLVERHPSGLKVLSCFRCRRRRSPCHGLPSPLPRVLIVSELPNSILSPWSSWLSVCFCFKERGCVDWGSGPVCVSTAAVACSCALQLLGRTPSRVRALDLSGWICL